MEAVSKAAWGHLRGSGGLGSGLRSLHPGRFLHLPAFLRHLSVLWPLLCPCCPQRASVSCPTAPLLGPQPAAPAMQSGLPSHRGGPSYAAKSSQDSLPPAMSGDPWPALEGAFLPKAPATRSFLPHPPPAPGSPWLLRRSQSNILFWDTEFSWAHCVLTGCFLSWTPGPPILPALPASPPPSLRALGTCLCCRHPGHGGLHGSAHQVVGDC